MAGSNSGFIQLRRGLSEHVRDGRLSFFEAALYVFILMDANPATGLCFGSAGLFAAIYGLSNRTCRDALEKLESKGYLKRFPTRGKHGSYPILINKFKCSDGAMKGKYVNCLKSSTFTNVVYDECDEDVNESAVASVNEDVNESAASKILDTGELIQDTKKKKPSGKDLPTKFVLPDWVDKEAWVGFEEMRKKKRAPLTDRAREGIIRDLEKLCQIGDNGAAILDQSTKKCWSGVFPLSQNNGGHSATISNGTGNQIMGMVNKSLGRTEYQNTARQDGDLPASVETGRSDARTIHASFDRPRHESLPSGDEEPLIF